MTKCAYCGKKIKNWITVKNWKGEMKKVCRSCYYGAKEYS